MTSEVPLRRRAWRPVALLLAVASLLGVGDVLVERASASVPPHCEVQRLAYCLWPIEQEIRLAPRRRDGSVQIDVAGSPYARPHRISEPWRCREGAADTIPGYPVSSNVRRGDDGWLYFTMRLRRDGSCDLEVAQQVPITERATQYDRVMWIPIIICLGEALAAYPGHPEPFPPEFTRQGAACSLKY